MLTFLATIGAVFLGFLAATGRLVVFAGLTLATAFSPPVYPRVILREMVNIGYFSLPVVGLTAIFTGMVLALQSYTGFSRFAGDFVHRPIALPSPAAPPRRSHHLADAGSRGRHHRRFWRICGWHLQAWLQSGGLSKPNPAISRDERCCFGSGEGGGIRVYRGVDGLLPRLLLTRRGTGSRPSDDLRGRLGLGLDSRLQL